ncbi:MAG: DUF3526 domain-containing protein [Chryseotalea sp.]|jgi:ABC-2 type transport system permease protein
MKYLSVLFFEWKHFVRNPFKVIAWVLFVAAAIYGLHNGASLFNKQQKEIEAIYKKVKEQHEKNIDYYQKGIKSPPDRPWVDNTTPFWAIWNLPTYHIKQPETTMVYSIGQAEQFGFYKQISVWASPYDADMAEEIANPERLQVGTLDFSFVILYLTPILLLLFVYNIKSTESEQGFLHLVQVQWGANIQAWLIARIAFYLLILLLTLTLLIVYGATLTKAISFAPEKVFQTLLICFLYSTGWLILYTIIIRYGTTLVSNTLQMIGLWLLFAFIIPSIVLQNISINKPVNLMLTFIDAQRDGREKIFAQADSVIDKQLFTLYPQIENSPMAKDSISRILARNFSASALVNHQLKQIIEEINNENESKNSIISSTYWFNPVTFFQNTLNHVSGTHYANYQHYRHQIQQLIDVRVATLTNDIWFNATVDLKKYQQYTQQFQTLPN